MRRTLTLAAPAQLAVELAVGGAAARRGARLYVVDNDTSQACVGPLCTCVQTCCAAAFQASTGQTWTVTAQALHARLVPSFRKLPAG